MEEKKLNCKVGFRLNLICLNDFVRMQNVQEFQKSVNRTSQLVFTILE